MSGKALVFTCSGSFFRLFHGLGYWFKGLLGLVKRGFAGGLAGVVVGWVVTCG